MLDNPNGPLILEHVNYLREYHGLSRKHKFSNPMPQTHAVCFQAISPLSGPSSLQSLSKTI